MKAQRATDKTEQKASDCLGMKRGRTPDSMNGGPIVAGYDFRQYKPYHYRCVIIPRNDNPKKD